MRPASSRARNRSRVADGPLERMGRIGWIAGELAAGGIVEKGRRLLGDGPPDATSALLSGANAQRLARRLSRLRGAAMKLGQLLSLEGDDFVPPEFAEALAVLRDDADSMPVDQLRGVLADEWGDDFTSRVRSFEEEPLAAASIGQVHRAEAHDGRRLALKIQYPGVARSINSDVDNLVSLFRWSRILPGDVDLAALGEEAKRQLREETDYLQEAERLARYAGALSDEPGARVPLPDFELTTSGILAMEYLPGLPLEELCGPDHSQAERDRVGTLLYRLLLRELFELHFTQSDPNFSNFLWLPEDRKVGLIDLGAGHPVPRALSRGYARMFRSALQHDRAGLREQAQQIGFVRESDPEPQLEGVTDLLALGCEPFAQAGTYDFGRSDLPSRLREKSIDLVFRTGFTRPPPVETLFLQRKLAGTFLLCARLRARIPLRELAHEFLPQLS